MSANRQQLFGKSRIVNSHDDLRKADGSIASRDLRRHPMFSIKLISPKEGFIDMDSDKIVRCTATE
jgi:hypothetical protein